MDDAQGSEGRDRAEADAEAARAEREWLERLYELNPWARGLDIGSDAFEVARQNACVNRWIEGVDVWNAWAAEMLMLRSASRKQDTLYEAATVADFSYLCFRNDVRFVRFEFPGIANFSYAQFGEKTCSPVDAHFDKAKFIGGNASFVETKFHGGEASFVEATFNGDASFYSVEFSGGPTWFDKTKFGGDAIFIAANFAGGTACFHKATFNDVEALFDLAKFSGGPAWFSGAMFIGGSGSFVGVTFDNGAEFIGARISRADFTRVNFDGPVTFDHTQFDVASFRSIKSERSFSIRATFKKTPDFREASFHEPPQLDEAEFTSSLTRRYVYGDRRPSPLDWAKHAPNKDEHAKFRALRGMAEQGNDHTSALRFNANEIAARRFWMDEPFGHNASRFWLGWLYQLVSDYGRSILRPLIGLFAVVATFSALFYAGAQSDDPKTSWTRACHESVDRAELKLQPTDKLTEAISLSIRNALIFDRSDTSRRTYGCLYGLVDNGRSGAIPTWVGKLSLLESLLSAIFLFLIGLALRNMFRLG